MHVVSLRYALRSSDRVTYVNPPPVEFETEAARFRLAEGKLACEMKAHFPTAEAARTVVEPVLRAWEVDADLRWNRDELRFVFDVADIIDRTPAPPGVIRGAVYITGTGVLTATGTVSVHVTRGRYPEPPSDAFRLNPDAESVLLRYRGYLDGREPLPAMAYFCRTVLGPGESAAATYRIDKAVLKKMSELSSTRGDPSSARKATAKQPLSGPETAWLEAAVKMLIWRLGDTRKMAAFEWIRMSDLPML